MGSQLSSDVSAPLTSETVIPFAPAATGGSSTNVDQLDSRL
jgi:hypothetical protein